MRKSTLHTLGALALLAPAAIAWTGVKSQLTVQPDSRLWVQGTSTVRSFECKAAEFDAVVTTTQDAAVRAVLAGQKAVGAVTLTVPAAKLDCNNGTMNGHMYKALKATEHGEITFRLSSYDLVPAGAGIQTTLRGELTLGGVTKPVVIEAIATDGGNGTLLVTGTHQIRMTEFGLKPPTLMMGTMKVNEKIDVRFELFLKS